MVEYLAAEVIEEHSLPTTLAWKYGFVLAYPRGKEEQTGYQWEPWHYRYVGVQDAKRIEDSGRSLQEFLESAGSTPRC